MSIKACYTVIDPMTRWVVELLYIYMDVFVHPYIYKTIKGEGETKTRERWISLEVELDRRSSDNKSRCDGRTLPGRVDVTVCWVFLVFISFTPCKLCSVVRGVVNVCACACVCVCAHLSFSVAEEERLPWTQRIIIGCCKLSASMLKRNKISCEEKLFVQQTWSLSEVNLKIVLIFRFIFR